MNKATFSLKNCIFALVLPIRRTKIQEISHSTAR